MDIVKALTCTGILLALGCVVIYFIIKYVPKDDD